MHVIFRDARVNKTIKITKQLIIFSYIHMTIFVKIRDQFILVDRDYFFHSRDDNWLKTKNEFFVYIIDVNFVVVQICNVTNQVVVISRNFKLKKLQNYDEKSCYLTTLKNRHLIVKSFNWLQKIFKRIIVDVVELIALKTIFHESTLFTTTMSNTNASSIFVATNLTSFNLKIVLSNNITIYENAFVCVKLSTITKIYLNIWQKKNDRHD